MLTEHNGVEVVTYLDFAETSLPNPHTGVKPNTTKVHTLHLANGETVYKCALCDHFAETVQGIVTWHLPEKHGGGRKRSGVPAASSEVLNLTVKELLDRIDEIHDAEQWQNRALVAERKLNELQKRLGKLVDLGLLSS